MTSWRVEGEGVAVGKDEDPVKRMKAPAWKTVARTASGGKINDRVGSRLAMRRTRADDRYVPQTGSRTRAIREAVV